MAGLVFSLHPVLAMGLLALTVTFHSSLQHEALHGHPTRKAHLNEALVFPPLGLFVPYRRYKSLHLDHHVDERLTDPFDDPESYYVCAGDWRKTARPLQMLLQFNNTLTGRLLIGPAVSMARFACNEVVRAQARFDAELCKAWAFHFLGLAAVYLMVHFIFHMPVLAYLLAAYLGLSIISIRSFCEHQWSSRTAERTVIIESGILSLLFLNNNLHLVHHRRPAAPWYALPGLYDASKPYWRSENAGYVFRSYWKVFTLYALHAKEPVAHPGLHDQQGSHDLRPAMAGLATADGGAV